MASMKTYFGEDRNVHLSLIVQLFSNSVIKHLLARGDSSNNDVLEFDSKLLFLSYDILAPILTKFYNISIDSKIVITDWKLSKVVPIYKGKGSKEDTGNYRPISLIGHIMKIFEK